MKKSLGVGMALFLAFCCVAGAQTVMTGQTGSGAFYRIEVPDGWEAADGLVIWNHGFDLGAIDEVSHEDLGPLVDVQLAEGYAVAASSYSLSGWALFQTLQDNRELVEVFEDAFDVPGQILVYGASLGGIVTAQAIEQGDLGNVVGAMPICGAMAGSRLWDGALDLRLLYNHICGGVTGAEIPGGADGLPLPLPPGYNELEMLTAVEVCFGIVLPPTPAQEARLAQLLTLTGLPVEFVFTDMIFATFGLHDLVYDPGKLDGMTAMENVGVDYDDAGVNAGIERVASDPSARSFLFDHFTPKGEVGDVKIVSIHTDKDGLVLVENQSEYASVVPASNLSIGVVVEEIPSHCGFTDAEALSAWQALRAWVAGSQQPTAADLQSDCDDLVAAGGAAGPCRYDPSFVIPDLDGRVRPRGPIFADGFESGDTSAWSNG